MPGTELRPPRRAQTNGISKQKKKPSSHLKRQFITITAIINNSQTHIKAPEDCLAISRSCNASPVPKQSVTQPAAAVRPPPPQVVLFFEHINGNSQTQRSHDEAARYCRSLRDDMSMARNRLQELLLPRAEVARAAEYAARWMPLYHGLYTLTYTFRNGLQLVATYERMQSSDVHPVLLAMHLLCVAVSLQQAPSSITVGQASRSEYITQICDVVEEVIVRKNVLAGTVEGLETCMLLLMLAVGRNDLTTICLTLKRLVALADLMGLPKAGYEKATSRQSVKDDPHLQAKLQIWEAICATDRNFGMMLKLPACTTSSIFPLHRLIWRDDSDISQSYNYYLARICGMVIAIDKSYSNEESEAESYKMVQTVDRALSTLASHVPKSWLSDSTGKVTDLIVKFWHPYIALRAHLRPAMILKEEYNASRLMVQESCLVALRMFCGFRTSVPSGFFYCRVLDIQAFTAAILLLLLKDNRSQETASKYNDIINQAWGCFKVVAAEGMSSFARKAVSSISSLQHFIDHGQSPSMTVHIPLLGNVRVERQEAFSMQGSDHPFHPQYLGTEDCVTNENIFNLENSEGATSHNWINFSIDFENDSPWTPPASRAGGYGRD